jgi:hypothetical protein
VAARLAAGHFALKPLAWTDKLYGPMIKSETLRSFAAEITKAIDSFSQEHSNSKRALTQLASSDPAVFFAAAIHVLATAKPSEGASYLIVTLAKDKRLSQGLLDPNICTLKEALAVTRAAAEAGVQLQPAFEMALNKALQGQSSPQKADRISRILDVLGLIGDPNCWNSFQVELMAYPDKMVRAKAALLVGRSTRNVAWIARRLLDRDPRVQASAVEALWGLTGEEVRPHFLEALKSSNNRVRANAALGLYFSGDVTAIRILLEMLRHDNPLFRLSAFWAIGETRDQRFLPALAQYYKHADGKLRLAAISAMSKIRRRDKSAQDAGALQLHIAQAARQTDGLRRLALALSSHPARDLRGVKPTDFAIWESGTLIEEYQVKLAIPTALLMAGFVAPWFASDADPYEKAVREGLQQCLCMKRGEDVWRIDRYAIEIHPTPEEKPSPESIVPYDDSLVTTELKAAQGFISDSGLLTKALALPVPRERAASNVLAAFERQCDIFAKRGGKHHVFLFLHQMPGFNFEQDDTLARLRAKAQESSVVLHGICADSSGKWPRLRETCLSNPEGSFTEVTLEGLVDGLVDAYANLCSRYEITYSVPAADSSPQLKTVRLKISSDHGYVESEVPLDLPPAPSPAVPVPEPTSTSQEVPQPVT